MRKRKKFYFILLIVLILIIALFLFFKLGGRSINIGGGVKSVNKGQVSPITGLVCENYNRRPVAAMLAMDPITRPLSGISSADLVVEMPVVTDSITRLMAVYVCEEPEEIGSARSARHDFIPLALGLDAIFAHWGGSHFALDKLDAGIIDNIDAMINPYNAYWQDWSKAMPHNGFTSMERLLSTSEKLGYRLENKFSGYPHLEDTKYELLDSKYKLSIGYPSHYKAYYEYSPQTNTYKRWREGKEEIDKNNNKQVEVSVVVIMRAQSRMIEMPDYNDVDVEGEGEAIIYQNGEEIKGFWKKKGSYSKSKLQFLDSKGKEVKFTPGKIWIQIMEPYQEVKWEIYD